MSHSTIEVAGLTLEEAYMQLTNGAVGFRAAS
jgi:hypothetical protein